jgi:hypothetical protein
MIFASLPGGSRTSKVERSPKAVAQVFNLHRYRIYLYCLASLIGLQNEILRYGRLKICATFSSGRQRKVP